MKKEWVEDCHSKRMRLSTQRYSLTPDLAQGDSEEEIFEGLGPAATATIATAQPSHRYCCLTGLVGVYRVRVSFIFSLSVPLHLFFFFCCYKLFVGRFPFLFPSEASFLDSERSFGSDLISSGSGSGSFFFSALLLRQIIIVKICSIFN